MSYKVSIRELEEFQGSAIWSDISKEIGEWLEDIRNDLESAERAPDMLIVKELQGSAKALRNVLKILINMKDNILEDLEKEVTNDKV